MNSDGVRNYCGPQGSPENPASTIPTGMSIFVSLTGSTNAHTCETPWAQTTTRDEVPRRAKPQATEVNSFPVLVRSLPKRLSKILLTAGTNDDPPVRNTASTVLGRTAHVFKSPSTLDAICCNSSEIQYSKDVRSTLASRSTTPSKKRNVATDSLDSSHLTA